MTSSSTLYGSCLLYRALIVQSARLPEWTKQSDVNLLHAIRTIGYGIPSLERAIGNSSNRITLITRGKETIRARQARIYQDCIVDNQSNPSKRLSTVAKTSP